MNKLEEICEKKREHVQAKMRKLSEHALRMHLSEAPPLRGFTRALRAKVDAGGIGLIAEIKKASPSKGLIRSDFSPAVLARSYAAGRATCLSVLTDEPYFQGNDANIALARGASGLPVLRKDFMLCPYQIIESRVLGADCILLIMAALSNIEAAELEALAHELGMDVLIEVHDEAELERAVTHLKSPLLGVNNRNLKTLEVDLATGERLATLMPADRMKVCESGVYSHNDVLRMKRAGYNCFLVGESLMRETDVTKATQKLLGATQ
ncbi:MAG: indole-3-glycerol phosphate synthase TrpC [Rickettsiales bacterium]